MSCPRLIMEPLCKRPRFALVVFSSFKTSCTLFLLVFASRLPAAVSTNYRAEIAVARAYAAASDWENASKHAEAALTACPSCKEASLLLTKAVANRNKVREERQWLPIIKADHDWWAGDYSSAKELALRASDSLTDDAAIEKVHDIVSRTPPIWNPNLLSKAIREAWPLRGALVALVIMVAYIILAVSRAIYLWSTRKTWRLGPIADESGLGIGERVQAKLLKWAAGEIGTPRFSSGLLSLKKQQVPPTINRIILEGDFAITTALQNVEIKLLQTDISALSKLLGAVRRWYSQPAPNIQGSVKVSKDNPLEVTAILIATDSRGAIIKERKRIAVATDSGTSSLPNVIDSVVIQMYYLLAHPNKPDNAFEAEAHIRRGLMHLDRYSTRHESTALGEALAEFTAAREFPDHPPTAPLFEGVALDLLERHKEAIDCFRQAASESPKELGEIARYNEAIAVLRQYGADSMLLAEEQFRKFGTSLDPKTSPVKALALAGRATAIAHFPIFWREILHKKKKSADESEEIAWKTADWPQIRQWMNEVQTTASELLKFAESPTRIANGWDPEEIKQLQWAAHNAIGNVCLNVQINYFEEPIPDMVKVERTHLKLLNEAVRQFDDSAKLMTPGVETLSNLGTATLYLGLFDKAREYLQQAIDLNPQYEYASYRLAQAWDLEGKRDRAWEVMRNLPVTIRIGRFRELYDQYLSGFEQ